MEITIPDQLAALAHPRRLDVFRLLMRRYPDAVPAGEIAAALDLRANTASVYLSVLRQAGLLSQTRQGTFLLYEVRMDRVRGLFGELLGDCCQNRPDLCLGALARPRPNPGDGGRPVRVLFVCSHNSARSIMAESLLNAASPRFQAFSAGTHPAKAPNPLALDILAEGGLNTAPLHSKDVSRFLPPDGPAVDMVITVCDRAANEDCGHWPGAPLQAHWSVADPMAQDGLEAQRAAMAMAFAIIREKVQALVAAAVDPSDLGVVQAHLDQIGRMHRGQARI